jgi:choline/glycine/proline betaine transport protein
MATIAPTAARNPIPWQRRLRNIAYLPKRSLVKRFMGDVIQPAMTLVQEELNKQGTISHISDTDDERIRLEVDLGNELNFIYEVRLRGYNSPASPWLQWTMTSSRLSNIDIIALRSI